MNFCPNCGASLSAYTAAEQGGDAPVSTNILATKGKYDQDKIWRSLLEQADVAAQDPPEIDALVKEALLSIRPGAKKTIVHLAMDKDVVPKGGVLHRATVLEGRTPMDEDRLKKMGYAVENGQVVMVDDIPVSPIYQALQYWGGDRQHKRWHMKYPIELDPSRNGNPSFMDECMVAFVAHWSDTHKMDEALQQMCTWLKEGLNGIGYGQVLAMSVVPQ